MCTLAYLHPLFQIRDCRIPPLVVLVQSTPSELLLGSPISRLPVPLCRVQQGQQAGRGDRWDRSRLRTGFGVGDDIPGGLEGDLDRFASGLPTF